MDAKNRIIADADVLPLMNSFSNKITKNNISVNVLTIQFSTKLDLASYLKATSYPIGGSLVDCANEKVDSFFSSVYWGRSINLGLSGLYKFKLEKNNQARYLYYLTYNFDNQELNNFIKRTENICMYISGGALGFGYKSNQIRINLKSFGV